MAVHAALLMFMIIVFLAVPFSFTQLRLLFGVQASHKSPCVCELFFFFAWLLLVLIMYTVFPVAAAVTPHTRMLAVLRYYGLHPDILMGVHLGLYNFRVGNICYL